MKKSLKKFALSAIKKSGLYTLASPWYSGCGSILMFHRICKVEEKSSFRNNSILEVTPEYLEKIILYFKTRGYDIVSIGDVPRILNGTGRRGNRFVVFTFDDGYSDNYTLAYPIFRKYKVPFTIYVATSFPDKTAVLWWYMLDELVSNNKTIAFDVNGTHYSFNCRDLVEKEATFISILKTIMATDASDFGYVIKAVFEKHEIDPRKTCDRLAIRWDMLLEMSKDSLVTIGAHSVNHLALKKLTEVELYNELLHSKNRIESQIKFPVSAFSYPFGGKNEAGLREFEAVKRTGFKTGTTTRLSNIFKQHKSYLASLPRVQIDGDNEDVRELEYVSGFIPFIQNRGREFVAE
jgi:peptidoglycan/xylan/chitin deacetylase (PgdA/CDA1 family)